MSLLVIALGEPRRADVEAALKLHFGAGAATQACWFDRGALRRQPVPTLLSLWPRRYDAAVLVAEDLDQPRLRLTSLLLALLRARGYWRLELREPARCERWSPAAHVAHNALPVARHAAACLLALALGDVCLRALESLLSRAPRTQQNAPAHVRGRTDYAGPAQLGNVTPPRVQYLRSQLWLGLSGGGSVAHTAGVIGGLQQLGAQVHVVSSDTLAGVHASTTVARPEMWFDGWLREVEDLVYNVAFLAAAWRRARAFRPHLIYQRHTAFNISGAVLSRVLRVPLVLEYNSSEVWKGRFWGGLRLERAAMAVERINLHAASRVIVVSRALRNDLVAAGVSPSRIMVNPNGVDPGIFRADRGGSQVRRQLGLDSSVVIGFSGTFGVWHGIPTLARAIPLVLSARPRVRWLIVGDGPLRGLLEADDPRVVRAGMLPHANMPEYLAACDVLVSPHGRQADGGEFFGSPTKLYEYMAAGRPIVASRVGQIGEVLEDELSALLVVPEDAEALASAIVRLVDDACLRSRLGAAARAAAEQRHTWRQNAERVLSCAFADADSPGDAAISVDVLTTTAGNAAPEDSPASAHSPAPDDSPATAHSTATDDPPATAGSAVAEGAPHGHRA